MVGQVIGGSIGTADTFDPASAHQAFGVPTVAGIVGHLIGQMLPESQPVR